MDILLGLPPNFKYAIEPPNNAPQFPTATLCNFAVFDNQFVFKQYAANGFLPFFTLPKGHLQEITELSRQHPFVHYRFILKSGLQFVAITNITLPPFEFLVPRELLSEPRISQYSFDIIAYFREMELYFEAHTIQIPFTACSRDVFDALLGLHGFSIPEELPSLRFTKDLSGGFRITGLNDDFHLCQTYPEFLVFPAALTEESIRKCAKFRSSGRLPTLSLHCANASVFRSAEPHFGYFNENSVYIGGDKDILAQISDELVVLDCRPFRNAFANKFQGKGMERSYKYENITRLEFLGLENIHYLRKAWEQLSDIFKDQCIVSTMEVEKLPHDIPSFITAEECASPELLIRPEPINVLMEKTSRTDWQGELRLLIVSTERARKYLSDGVSILLHCSDGWDRTAQMSALIGVVNFEQFKTVKSLLDLVYREFFDFGHKIGSRNGNLMYKPNIERESSPILLLFLDAVRQVREWNRSMFGFGENLLLFLAFHIKSLMFAGFECDCARDRIRSGEKMQVFDVIMENISQYEVEDADTSGHIELADERVGVWWRYWNSCGW